MTELISPIQKLKLPTHIYYWRVKYRKKSAGCYSSSLERQK